MDRFLLELVERIADSQFSGVWLLFCNGDAGYRLMFGGAPGGLLDEIQGMTGCWHPTPDEAAKAAIADELPGLFDAVDCHTPSTPRFMGCGRGDD